MTLDIIILDLGANDGCSILKFRQIMRAKRIKNYKIYSFEPSPYFQNFLNGLVDHNTTVYNKLVGIKNEQVKLYLSQEGDDGSSIYSDKISNNVQKDVYITCESIDIVEFINKLPPHKELWIKMDIEGGEYKIIPHLHKYNCLNKINKLFIEWHHHKITSISNEFHEKTVSMVKNIEQYEWNALNHKRIARTSQYYKNFIEAVKQLKNK